MAKYSQTINYHLKTSLDKSGITKLQTELQLVENELRRLGSMDLLSDSKVKNSIAEVGKLRKAIDQAYNPKLGMLDNKKLSRLIKDNEISVARLGKSFANAGTTGQIALSNVISRLGQMDTGIKSISSAADKVFNTIGNTVRWGIVASGFSQIMNSVYQTVEYVKDLDSSLTNIMMVTDYSRESMQEYAKSANDAAKALGSTTVAMTDATLVFAQQGFDLKTSSQLAERSTKLANVSQQDTATTSDQITAYMNAYGIDGDMDAIDRALDAWAEIANVSAADVQELATASQKAASTARTVGVDMDQLAAQIATIESVTREAPENIGNGLKTIYARFSDIKMGNTMEDGVDLGKVTETLDKVGIEVLDTQGKMRDVGDIMEDLMKIWTDLDKTQQTSIAETLAGKYQLSRFTALMNRGDMYEEYKNAAENAEGTMDAMQAKYIDSVEAKANILKSTFEGIVNDFFDAEDMKGFLDAVTQALNLVQQLVDALGGGDIVLQGLGATAIKVFSNQIGKSINGVIENRELNKAKKNNPEYAKSVLSGLGLTKDEVNDENAKQFLGYVEGMSPLEKYMSDEQKIAHNQYMKETGEVIHNKNVIDKQVERRMLATQLAYSAMGGGKVITKEEDGSWNYGQYINDLGANPEVGDFKNIKSDSKAREKISDYGAAARGIVDAKTYEEAAEALQKYKGQVESLGQASKYTLNELEDFYKILHDHPGTQEAEEALAKVTQEAIDAAERVSLVTSNEGKNLYHDAEEIDSDVMDQGRADAAFEAKIAEGEATQASISNQALIGSIVDVTAAVGQLAFAWEAFQNLGSIWENTDLDIGEKIVQSIMLITTALGAVVPAFMSLSKIPEILVTLNEKVSKNSDETQENTEETLENAAAKKAQAEATEDAAEEARQHTVELEKETAAMRGQQGQGKKPSPGTLPKGGATPEKVKTWQETIENLKKKEKTQKGGLNKNQQEELDKLTSYVDGATTAGILLDGDDDKKKTSKKESSVSKQIDNDLDTKNKKLGKMGGIAGKIGGILTKFAPLITKVIGPLAAVTTALMVVKEVSEKIYEWWNKDKILAEEMSKQAEIIREDYGQAQEQLSSFIDQKAKWDDAIQKINELTRGTKEYKEAIQDANEEMLKLLDLYPELAQYVKRNGDGLLTVSEQDMEKFEEAKQNAVDFKKADVLYADAMAAEQNQKAANTDVRRSITVTKWQTIPGAIGPGGHAGPVTTVAPQVLGEDQMNQIFTMMEQKGEQSIYDKENIAEALGLEVTDPMVQAIVESADKLVNAFTDTKNTELNGQIKKEEAARGYLKANGYDISGPMADAAVQEIIKEADKLYAQKSQSYRSSEHTAQDMISQFAEDRGLSITSETNKAAGNKTSDKMAGDTTLSFTDADGIKKEFTYDQIVNENAQQDSMQEAASNWEAVGKKWDDIANKMLAAGATEEQIQATANAVNADGSIGKVDFSGFSLSELKQMEKSGLDYTALFGAKDFDEFKKQRGLAEDITQEQFEEKMRGDMRDAITVKDPNAYKRSTFVTQAELEDERSSMHPGEFTGMYSKNFDVQSKELSEGATSVNMLNKDFEDGYMLQEDYNNGLIRLGKGYADLEESVKAVENKQKAYNEAVKTYGKNSDEAKAAAKDFKKAQQELERNLVVKEFEKARKNLAHYSDALDDSKKDTEEYGRATRAIATGLSEALNKDISSDFVEENASLVQEWLNGSAEAGAKLRALAYSSANDATTLMTALGGTAEGINAAINSLDFDIHGTADFSQVLAAMSNLNAEMLNTEQGCMTFAQMLSNLGATKLTWKGSDGSDNLIDVQEVIAKLNSGDAAQIADAMQQLQAYLHAYTTGMEVKGTIPADIPPETVPAGTPGGGGGGGGGGSKPAKPVKFKKEKSDRYERVNALLGDAAKDYEKIEKATSRMTTGEAYKYLEKQTGVLQKQIDLQKQKLEIQKQEAAELKNQLANEFDIQFDEEGFITNYQQVWDNYQNKIAELTDQLNATQDSSARDKIQEQIDAQNEKFAEFKEAHSRYNTLVSEEIASTELAITDIQHQIEDLRIEAYKTKIEAIEQLNELRDLKIDIDIRAKFFGKDTLERDMEETRRKAQKFMSDDAGTNPILQADAQLSQAMEQWRQYQETGTSSIYGSNSKAIEEALDEAMKKSEEAGAAAEEMLQEFEDNLASAIEKTNELIEERMEKYNNLNDALEHQLELTKLIKGEAAYDEMNEIIGMQFTSKQNQILEYQKVIKSLTEKRDTFDEDSEQWKELNQQIIDAQNEVNDLITESLDLLQQQYMNNIDKTLLKWQQNAFGDKLNLDLVSQEWERINERADLYLDQTNAAYSIQKLQGKYLQTLDNASGVRAQEMISEQMKQQLKYLREKKNLSEYDVAYANAQLDILQKRIALEEAERNKSQMKLRRDSQGNYGYVYTANEGDIAKAEEALMDAENNAYNLSKSQMQEVQGNALQAFQNAMAQIREISTSTTLDQEQKAAEIEKIQAHTNEMLTAMSEQLGTAQTNLLKDFLDLGAMMSEENGSRIQDVMDAIANGNENAFNEIDERWGSSIDKWLSDMDSLTAGLNEAFGGITEIMDGYSKQIESFGNTINKPFDTMGETVGQLKKDMEALIESTTGFYEALNDKTGVIDSAKKQLDDYKNKVNSLIGENTDVKKKLDDAYNQIEALKIENARLNEEDKKRKEQEQKQNENKQNSSSGGGGSGSKGKNARSGDIVGFSGYYYETSYGGGYSGNILSGQSNAVRISSFSGSPYGNSSNTGEYSVHIETKDGGHLGWIKPTQLFDTGGYTGTWTDGSPEAKNGKLAFLHQKEIVLNAEDTANILKAVNSVRGMTENLKSGAFDAVISRLNSFGSNVIKPNENQQIDQHLDITATFPNVKSADEVEQALLSLADQAVQYAFRK